MSSEYPQLSLWSTIGFVISNGGSEEKSTREEITSILVDSLSGIGAVEFEYSYTGITSELSYPEAYVFDEDGKTLRLILMVGVPNNGLARQIESDYVIKRTIELVENLNKTYANVADFDDTGADELGEFVYLLKKNGRSIKTVRLTIVVLGNIENSDELSGFPTGLQIGEFKCPLVIDVYDIDKLQKAIDSASNNGTVDIDFRDYIGSPLRCLQSSVKNTNFETYLAIIPGDAVAAIYARFQTRVLQRNVRNFLQATGKVNKGIQKSLKEKPEKFLAFNNGLTITASAVQLNESNQIEILRDFQIVNGGQTTASLDFAKRYSGLNLSDVSIQAKIVVIDIELDPTFIDDVSNYANSQNKVKTSDFASRDSFHINLGKLMQDERLIFEWDDGQRNLWFYEAFRGGYNSELGQRSGNRRKNFQLIFPKSQVINKLELAKCENAWDGYPYHVCKGDDMNFTAWNKRTKPNSRQAPDIQYCMDLIAKVILWRATLAIPKDQKFSGYRSQISAMAYSYLVYLLELKNYEVDLRKIWDMGCVPDEILDEINEIVYFVKDFLPKMTEEDNPAQWAKKQNSWEKLKDMKYKGATKLVNRLLRAGLLREKTADYDLLVVRAIEVMENTGRSLNRGELLVQLNLDPIHWDRFRKELLSNGEVVQTGSGPGSRYTTSP